MKSPALSLAVLLVGLFISGCESGNTLARGGKSDYRIVISADASISTVYGANELQRFLKEMAGAYIPVVSDLEPMTGREIIIGNNKHLDNLQKEIDFEALG